MNVSSFTKIQHNRYFTMTFDVDKTTKRGGLIDFNKLFSFNQIYELCFLPNEFIIV